MSWVAPVVILGWMGGVCYIVQDAVKMFKSQREQKQIRLLCDDCFYAQYRGILWRPPSSASRDHRWMDEGVYKPEPCCCLSSKTIRSI